MEALYSLDQTLFEWLHLQATNPLLDQLLPWWRNKESWIPLYVIVAIFLGFRYKWSALWIILLAVAVVGISDPLNHELIKPALGRLRPCNDLADQVRHLEHWPHCPGSFSLPSSHAWNHFALAGVFLWIYSWRWYTVLGLIWAASVSYAQVYLGLHYPMDILLGALLGLLTAYLLFKVWTIKAPLQAFRNYGFTSSPR
jgi:undecaprenyl-diphosphatase